MRLILVLVAKDIRRRIADPAGLLLHLAIPLAIAGMMALAFGGRGGGANTPVMRIVAVDLDETPFSGFLAGASQNPEAAGRLEIKRAVNREEGLAVMHDEEFAAMVVIPKGFSDALLGGTPTQLELTKNPAQNIMPVVAQQGGEVVALYLSVASRFVGSEGPRVKRLFDEDGGGWSDSVGLAATLATLYGRMDASRTLLFPPLIEIREPEKPKKAEEENGLNWMAWMYPGIVVMGLLFTGLTQMRDLLHERTAGTLRRQLTAPLGAGQLLIAKVLSVAAVVAIAHVCLLVIGSIAFGVHWGPLLPLVAVSALVILATTGFAAMVFAIVRTERQGDAFGGILTMLMSMVGGAFIPPQALPVWLRGVSQFTLNHWSNEALRALSLGGGWAEVRTFMLALALIGGISCGLGILLLRSRHMRGAL